ncbi:UNVERIFIED_CONTAM: hypothetical protein FKN15_064036 [Acipenser sinensis]
MSAGVPGSLLSRSTNDRRSRLETERGYVTALDYCWWESDLTPPDFLRLQWRKVNKKRRGTGALHFMQLPNRVSQPARAVYTSGTV